MEILQKTFFSKPQNLKNFFQNLLFSPSQGISEDVECPAVDSKPQPEPAPRRGPRPKPQPNVRCSNQNREQFYELLDKLSDVDDPEHEPEGQMAKGIQIDTTRADTQHSVSAFPPVTQRTRVRVCISFGLYRFKSP